MQYIPALSDHTPTSEAALRILRTHAVDILVPLIVFLVGGYVLWQKRLAVQQPPKQQEQEQEQKK